MDEYKGILDVYIYNLLAATWHSCTSRFLRSHFPSAGVLGSFSTLGAWFVVQGTLAPGDGMWCFPVEMLRTLKLLVISEGKSWLACDLPSEVGVERWKWLMCDGMEKRPPVGQTILEEL